MLEAMLAVTGYLVLLSNIQSNLSSNLGILE